jgi:tRNA-binding protein
MGHSAAYLSYDEFDRAHIRIGRVVDVQDFLEARQAADRILIDFGPDIGIRKSSARHDALRQT